MHRIDVLKSLKLTDGNARQFGVTTPLTLTGYDEVEVEFTNQSHTVSSRGIVYACKNLIQ
jgi:hypothetical protein